MTAILHFEFPSFFLPFLAEREYAMPEAGDQFAHWLAEARAGSPDALGQVLDACRHYLLLIADEDLDPALREKGGASDLVQQTFLEAQTAFPRFQGGTQDELLAWMRKLLRNNLIDFTRRFRDVAKRSSEREVAIDAQETPSQSASM